MIYVGLSSGGGETHRFLGGCFTWSGHFCVFWIARETELWF